MDPILFLSPENQLWILVIGALVPLAGYVLNKKLPQTSENAKGIFQVILAAAAGVVYQIAIASGDVISEQTLQLVLAAIIAALFTHGSLWKPAKINTKLGARETDVVRE